MSDHLKKIRNYTSMNIPGLGRIEFAGFQENKPTIVKYPGGTEKLIEYNAADKIKSIIIKSPKGDTILHHEYGFDPYGNIINKKTENGAYRYGYDRLHELIRVERDDETTEEYAYDGAGNRSSSKESAGWEYNADNELLRHNGAEYTYDDNGNTVRISRAGITRNLVYDTFNRLIEVDDENRKPIAKYSYDQDNRRIKKEVFRAPQESQITYYLYLEEGLIGEYDANGNEIRSYGHPPDLTWTKGPVFMRQGGRYYFFHKDCLDTPQKLTDVDGKVVWSAEYDAFGNARVNPDSTIANNLRFPGQFYDEETGLHYNYHRYYDPQTGRYLTPDPLGLAAGDSNLYRYVFNNPVNKSDSHGLFDDDYDSYLEWKNSRWKSWSRNIEKSMKNNCHLAQDGYSTEYTAACLEDYRNMRNCINDEEFYFNESFINTDREYLGHANMYGSKYFDWVKQDHGTEQPYPDITLNNNLRNWYRFNTTEHFKLREKCLVVIEEAKTERNKDKFERAMHQYQDWFCHVEPVLGLDLTGRIIWHLLKGTKPDENMDAWERAHKSTQDIVEGLKKVKLSQTEKLQCGYDNLYDKWINEKSLPFDFGQEKYDEGWKENKAEELKKAESDKP